MVKKKNAAFTMFMLGNRWLETLFHFVLCEWLKSDTQDNIKTRIIG